MFVAHYMIHYLIAVGYDEFDMNFHDIHMISMMNSMVKTKKNNI